MAASTRRAPLASIPNATNSPHRFVTASGSKRPRALAGVTQQENEPPSKRQAVEKPGQEHGLGTPRYQQHSVEGKVFERGHGETGTTAFQRRLVAARDKTAQPVQSRTTRSNTNANTTVTTKDVDTIRQWQKHYRKLFPSFSFYFDSVPEDQKSRFVRQIHYLGAVSHDGGRRGMVLTWPAARRKVLFETCHPHHHHPTNSTGRQNRR